MADDLGWNDVGFHGSEIETPNIDGIASRGIELDRFYVQPSCSPTRAALMTGKSPVRLGIVRPLGKLDPAGLPIGETILPEYLHEAGYQTFMTGKWHLGHAEKRYFPHRRGFDHFYGHVTGGIGYWDHTHGGGLDWQRNGVSVREKGYSTHLITDEAIALLKTRDPARPTFLYVAYNAPHLPNEAPQNAIDRYAHIEDEIRRVHAAMVSELDASIGRLLGALEAQGMRDDAIVWFMSDNGGLSRASQPPGLVSLLNGMVEVFGTPLPLAAAEFTRTNILDGGSDNRPLRGGKMFVLDGGARVPSALWWPGHIEGGQTELFVTAQDVLPTLLEMTGLASSIPDGLDGISRFDPLAKGDHDAEHPDYLTVGMDGTALYSGPWKLWLPATPLPFSSPPPELYRIREDPLEQQDLAGASPEVVEQMIELVDGWPRGPEVHGSLWDVLVDPDRFGGDQDREPWADVAR
ncbi:MAG: sulfatase-like hydrolase/transferase [Deltaproteobacteria bacterium]|nr:sulfatase-like hydrolase/transferase [Deltaproteobacteria bacterium]MBW2396789.1 sulfatase-like hydrolase/transferase [Deltaproteobacteria bacterium]